MDLHLNSYGLKLSITNGMFKVEKDGEVQKIPVKDVKNIYINRGTGLSADVLFVAIENNIAVLLTGKGGKSYGRVWSANYGSISLIRKMQLTFSQSQEAAQWIIQVLHKKFDNQQLLLYVFDAPGIESELESVLGRIEKAKKRLTKFKELPLAQLKAKVMGIEGAVSKEYFRFISNKIPVQYKFELRSQRPAMDMFNSMLNYVYGILYGTIEGELIKAGLDPYVGILHMDQYNKPVLAYDIIELYRVWGDAVVIDLCQQGVIFPEFFDIEEGSYWLNDLGKKILIMAFTDYLNEVITLNGYSASRRNQIARYCSSLASALKKNKFDELCS